MVEKKVKSDQLGRLRLVKATTQGELDQKAADLGRSWKEKEEEDFGPRPKCDRAVEHAITICGDRERGRDRFVGAAP